MLPFFHDHSWESAIALSQEMKKSGKTVDDIERVNIKSTEATKRIIDKAG